MTNVYVVTTGDYSNYHIDAIFSTKALAEDYKNKWERPDDAEIAEWELDEEKDTRIMTRVMMKQNGDSKVWRPLSNISGFERYNSYDDAIYWVVDTDSEERAVKVVNEKRAQILALGIWGNEEAIKQQIR